VECYNLPQQRTLFVQLPNETASIRGSGNCTKMQRLYLKVQTPNAETEENQTNLVPLMKMKRTTRIILMVPNTNSEQEGKPSLVDEYEEYIEVENFDDEDEDVVYIRFFQIK